MLILSKFTPSTNSLANSLAQSLTRESFLCRACVYYSFEYGRFVLLYTVLRFINFALRFFKVFNDKIKTLSYGCVKDINVTFMDFPNSP